MNFIKYCFILNLFSYGITSCKIGGDVFEHSVYLIFEVNDIGVGGFYDKKNTNFYILFAYKFNKYRYSTIDFYLTSNAGISNYSSLFKFGLDIQKDFNYFILSIFCGTCWILNHTIQSNFFIDIGFVFNI